MKCESCQVDIPPAWKNVIVKNICPNCEGEIMSSKSMELLDQIKEAIAQMAHDPEGLAAWMLSTFDLLPKGTIQATNFYDKRGIISASGPEPSYPGLKVANTATSQFMKRAGADKIMQDPKMAVFKAALDEMNKGADTAYGTHGGTAEEVEPELTPEDEAAEAKRIAQIAAQAKAEGRRVTMKELLANEASIGATDEELPGGEISAIQNLFGGPEEDLSKLHPVLQADRLKRLGQQRDFSRSFKR